MKTLKLIALMFLVLGMASCKNDSSTNTNKKDDAFKTMTTKEIIESGTFISATILELEDMEKEAASRSGQEERPTFAIPAYRAAHYRFVTHAKQDENGTLTWTATCGADLNMSDELFNYFANDFKMQNDLVQKHIKQGTKYTPIWINEEYLNNILSDEFIETRMKEMKDLRKQIEKGEFIELK